MINCSFVIFLWCLYFKLQSYNDGIMLLEMYLTWFQFYDFDKYKDMNYIQKGWLKVLSPVVTLVNDKLATRSGVIGKVGRFFAFGPRQFGYHPINRYFAVANQILVQNIGLATHRYSFIKYLSIDVGDLQKQDSSHKDLICFHHWLVWSLWLLLFSGWQFLQNSTTKSKIVLI